MALYCIASDGMILHQMALYGIGAMGWHEMAWDGMVLHLMASDGIRWRGIASDRIGWHGMVSMALDVIG